MLDIGMTHIVSVHITTGPWSVRRAQCTASVVARARSPSGSAYTRAAEMLTGTKLL